MREARILGSVEGVHDAGQHGGDDEGVGDALAARQLDPGLGFEGGELDDPSPRVDGAYDGRDAGHVVGRHAHQRGIVFGCGAELDGAEDVGDQVLVPQHRGLRGSRRAAREQEHGDVFGIHRPARVRPRAFPRAGEEGLPGHHAGLRQPRQRFDAHLFRDEIGGHDL
jgi:hypothetical protein